MLRMCSTLCALSNVYMRSIMIGATLHLSAWQERESSNAIEQNDEAVGLYSSES